MREVVTTLLDTLALLAVAAGVCVCLGVWLSWGLGLIAAGLLLFAGSWFAARQGEARGEGEAE